MPHLLQIEHALSKPRLRASLEQLLEARTSAESLKLDTWMLAVEIGDLLDVGCTKTLLRLLAAAGFIHHAEDITRRSDPIRSFRPECPLKFGPHTCFVLTDAGLRFLKGLELPATELTVGHLRHDQPHTNGAKVERATPIWDPISREFFAGRQLLKRFTRPAPVLDLVLSSFQELDWPPRLDDPLPPARDVVAAERLRDTVRRLNRCQDTHTVRFSSDGMGTGIRWEWILDRDEPRMNHG